VCVCPSVCAQGTQLGVTTTKKALIKAYLPYLTKKKFNLLSSRERFASVKGFLEEAISISMQGDF